MEGPGECDVERSGVIGLPVVIESDMLAPLVTICVPTIGRTEYLTTALRSLREQTYPNSEVLVLDNACAAEAHDLLAAFASAHANARILRLEERVSMFANFNRGIRAARGKYVAFFHDDDLYQPTFLERHISVLEANPRAAFAAGNFDIIDRDGAVTGKRRGIRRTETVNGRLFIKRLFRRGRSDLPTPGLVFRRAPLSVRGFDERLPINWGDFTVLMRLAETWDVGVVSEVLFSWRVHGQNLSNMAWDEAVALRTRVLLDYCSEYSVRHPSDAAFAQSLQQHAHWTQARDLIWGWLAAEDGSGANACRLLLRSSHSTTAEMLRILETCGLTLKRRHALLPMIRYAADLVSR